MRQALKAYVYAMEPLTTEPAPPAGYPGQRPPLPLNQIRTCTPLPPEAMEELNDHDRGYVEAILTRSGITEAIAFDEHFAEAGISLP